LSIELLLIRLCQLNQQPATVDDKKKITIEPLVGATTSETTASGATTRVAPTPNTTSAPLPVNSKMRISLKPQDAQPEKPVEPTAATVETPAENQPFTQENLTQVWQQYAAQESDIHVKNTLLNSTPQKQDDHKIAIAVFNPTQEKALQDRMAEMKQFLAQQLHHSFLELNIHISEAKQDFKPYTNKEKYEAMAEKNPSIATLVQEFSLQLN
jgi:DNA polymerase-3 subunit gamma/tau